MFCENCGTRMEPGAARCPQCGHQPSPSAQQPPPFAPTQGQSPATQQPPPAPAYTQAPPAASYTQGPPPYGGAPQPYPQRPYAQPQAAAGQGTSPVFVLQIVMLVLAACSLFMFFREVSFLFRGYYSFNGISNVLNSFLNFIGCLLWGLGAALLAVAGLAAFPQTAQKLPRLPVAPALLAGAAAGIGFVLNIVSSFIVVIANSIPFHYFFTFVFSPFWYFLLTVACIIVPLAAHFMVGKPATAAQRPAGPMPAPPPPAFQGSQVPPPSAQYPAPPAAPQPMAPPPAPSSFAPSAPAGNTYTAPPPPPEAPTASQGTAAPPIPDFSGTSQPFASSGAFDTPATTAPPIGPDDEPRTVLLSQPPSEPSPWAPPTPPEDMP